MKKSLIIALSFILLQLSTVFANPFLDNYPEQTMAALCFEPEWSYEFLGYTNKDNEFTKAFNEVRNWLKSKFNVDLVKDSKELGIFVVSTQEGADYFGLISGNLNSKKLVSMIKAVIADAHNEEIKIGSIRVNGKEIQTIQENDKVLVFYSDELVLFGKESICKALENKSITFAKAPQTISKMVEKTKAFAYLSNKSLGFLEAIKVPHNIIEGIDSISGYFDENNINLEITAKDSSSAQKIKEELEKAKNEYAENYSKEYENNKESLKNCFIGDLTGQIGKMYAEAKAMDFINCINLDVNNNSLILSAKAVTNQILPGLIGMTATWYTHSVTQSRNHAQRYSCFSTQRAILGAVEMYNMDYSENEMTTLNINKLINEGYLGQYQINNDSQCEYESIGDLTKDGLINCKIHGNPWQAAK